MCKRSCRCGCKRVLVTGRSTAAPVTASIRAQAMRIGASAGWWYNGSSPRVFCSLLKFTTAPRWTLAGVTTRRSTSQRSSIARNINICLFRPAVRLTGQRTSSAISPINSPSVPNFSTRLETGSTIVEAFPCSVNIPWVSSSEHSSNSAWGEYPIAAPVPACNSAA